MLSVGDDIKSEGWRAGTLAVEPGTRGVWEVEVRRRSATTANLLRNFHIPSDFVVKTQAVDIVEVIL